MILKGGARLIGIIDAGVPPHLVQLLLIFGPQRKSDPGRQPSPGDSGFRRFWFRVKGSFRLNSGTFYHGHELPVLRIHDNNGHLLVFSPAPGKPAAPRISVYSHPGLCAGRFPPMGSIRSSGSILYLHALCVGHGEDASVHSLQIVLVFYLQADDALVVSPVNPRTLDARLS